MKRDRFADFFGRFLGFLPLAQRRTVIQFLKFGIIGGTAFFLDNAIVYGLIYIGGFDHDIAGLMSFPFVATYTWLGNRLFTFHDMPKTALHQQWAKFIAVCCIGLVFNRGTYIYLDHTQPLFHSYPVLALMAGTAVAMFFNFYAAKRLVFK